jgi:predicted nucleotidyltransferase
MGIKKYQNLLDRFVQKNIDLLGDNLIDIYLHGSAVTGCFNAEKSDIDLLTVVENDLSYETKKMYMDMTIEFNKEAPPKGMELSIVKEEFLKPFAYPTPYELHFSLMHLDWYRSNPNEYIEKMKGTDKDLAAHVTVIYHRGKTLYGKEIKEVFSPVGKKEYFDSLWHDIHNCEQPLNVRPFLNIRKHAADAGTGFSDCACCVNLKSKNAYRIKAVAVVSKRFIHSGITHKTPHHAPFAF